MAVLRSPGSVLGRNDTNIGQFLGGNFGAASANTQSQPSAPPIPSIAGPVPVNKGDAQGGVTPAERGQVPGAGGGAPRGPMGPGGQATPSTSMTPSTQLNGSIMAPGQQPGSPLISAGPVSFQPLPGYNPGSMVTPQAGGVPGSLGGLRGGGLGVPLQPSNPALDNPISLLMQLLQGGMK